MSADPLELRLLLQKYLYSNCTKDELKKFWRLMFELPGHEVVSEELKKLWDDNTLKEPPFSELPDWEKVSERIQCEKRKSVKDSRKKMVTADDRLDIKYNYRLGRCSFKMIACWLCEKYYTMQVKLITVYK